ncbi:MAG: fused MFS/spermidine synthase [Saprospiraceae bacterium]|nr:fused MFS/spermidine synthase [Saprospiraceae bacterium]
MNRTYFYLLSFLEGGAVMACELIGAKMLAPYFGTSLYVWAAALGLTLGGLMTGYFTGGLLSKRYPNRPSVLYWVLILAGLMLVLMPFTSEWVMSRAIDFSLQFGAVISLLVFMFPPLIFMGMVSPLIINLLNTRVKDAGNSAGNVYAISTLGGILVTFLMGFRIIPGFGINYPAIITGVALGVLPILSLLHRRQTLAMVPAGLFALAFVAMGWKMQDRGQGDFTIHYHSEGVLGQIKVLDMPFEDQGEHFTGRGLVVNNTLQTVMNLEDPDYDFWPYTRYIPLFAAAYPEGSKALLLGMGGGTLVDRLDDLQMDLEVVEIDERIRRVAVEYFGLDPSTEVIIDDARHFLRARKDPKYDIIIYDTFISESAPEHILTLEGLQDARSRMKPGGTLLINFYGYLEGNRGEVVRSVYKTLQKAGYQVQLFTTPGPESDRNILFVATEGPVIDWHQRVKAWPEGIDSLSFEQYFLPADQIDTSHAVVLTDRRPQLELYARASADWRKLYNQFYTRKFSRFKKY